MHLILPKKIAEHLGSEVRRRNREIGGVLVGEHIRDDVFRISDASVQTDGGSFAHFTRNPEHSRRFLDGFFERTKDQYRKFNYIGEWHSHPWFSAKPSPTDIAAMEEITNSPEVGVNFLVLLVFAIGFLGGTKLSATLFQRGQPPQSINVEIMESPVEQKSRRRRIII